MQTPKQINISKTMSYALRHKPKQFDLELDEYGFVDINIFLSNLKKYDKKCKDLTMDELKEIVKTCPKQRYEIKDGKIRAKGGHSKKIGVKIKGKAVVPPDILYHGTTPEAAELILKQGILSMERQRVDMSEDIETAVVVGKRRCNNPVIFEVNAKQAYLDGMEFYLESIKTYSVESCMPVKYIKIIKR